MASFPYDIVDAENNEELKKLYDGINSGFVQVGPSKFTYPGKYRQIASRIYNFESRPDDVWVCTFPRSGTTLTQELTWIVANDVDLEKAKVPLTTRFPMLEASMIMDDEVVGNLRGVGSADDAALLDLYKDELLDFVEKMPSPRFIKTHLPFSLMPKNALEKSKIIYSARNPLDCITSFYQQCLGLDIYNFIGNLDTFWSQFEAGSCMFGPYFAHIKEAWEQRNHPNVLFIFYEDFIKDRHSTIRKVAKFLNKTLTEEQVDKAAEHMKFDNFKKNPAVNLVEVKSTGMMKDNSPFIRKGKIGSWKEEMSPETQARAKKWLENGLKELESVGFKYPEV